MHRFAFRFNIAVAVAIIAGAAFALSACGPAPIPTYTLALLDSDTGETSQIESGLSYDTCKARAYTIGGNSDYSAYTCILETTPDA